MTTYTAAVDDTSAAWRTVDWIDRNVRAEDSVRLLTVSEFYGESPVRSGERLLAAERLLLRGHPGLQVTLELSGGPTVERILLDGDRSDVLVLGAQQVHAFAAAVTGRTTERVVAHAPTPIVVVPERWELRDGPVVVGVDSRTAAEALEFGADRAVRDGRGLVLVRAWQAVHDALPYSGVYLDEDRGLWEEEGRLELDAAARAVGARCPGLAVRAVRREGRAADALLEESGDASLIVVGRRHRTALGAFMAGSVGERLIHRAHAPVCVVPPRTALRPAVPVEPAALDAGTGRR